MKTKLGILLGAGMLLSLGACGNMFGHQNTASTAPAVQPDPQVMQLQRALVANGENVRVDGVMGPETVTALRDYQQQHGLQPTGQMDAQTRTSLNLPG